MAQKRALVTGVTGQGGSYLLEILVRMMGDYEVALARQEGIRLTHGRRVAVGGAASI